MCSHNRCCHHVGRNTHPPGRTTRQRRQRGGTEIYMINKKDLIKTELCVNWIERGSCRYGRRCDYAHGESDLHERLRCDTFKTQPCGDSARGLSTCTEHVHVFVHGGRREGIYHFVIFLYSVGVFDCSYGERCNYVHPGLRMLSHIPCTSVII